MDKMRKARQSGFSFAESLITVTILAFVAIGIIGVTAKKNTFNANVKAKHGTYECFKDGSTVLERYTYKGVKPLAGGAPKNNPGAVGADCVFVQPAYVNTICINISGGGGGSSNPAGTPPSDYAKLGGSAGETKSMCLSATANPDATATYAYKIKIGNGGLQGQNGGASVIRKPNDTIILSAAGGISGTDVTNRPNKDTGVAPDRYTGEKSGLDNDEDYGSGGDENQPGKGGYVGITW